jgi:hypothetical protein
MGIGDSQKMAGASVKSVAPELCCRWTMLVIHAVWAVYVMICVFSMNELFSTMLGGALDIAVICVAALVVIAELMRRKNKTWWGDFGRPPRFTFHTLAGIVAIGAASFGIVACFNLDMPNEALFHFGKNSGPLSRWVFIVIGVFGFTAFYGVLAVLIGSGLWGTKKAEQATQISQIQKPEEKTV